MGYGAFSLLSAPLGITVKGCARLEGALLFGPLELPIPAGRWSCLLGVSGVGKSTLLRFIAGLDTGAVFEGGISASDGQPLTGRVAYMAQSDLLLPWASVLDNAIIGARLRGERPDYARARALIARVGLLAHISKKPGSLSGGQRQRAALARTLMENREIILLDEPFSALDAKTRSEMQDLAVELLAGRTVLLVTHDPGEAARLGHFIHIMTPLGLQSTPAPASAVPRLVDDAAMLRTQGALLRQLRQEAV